MAPDAMAAARLLQQHTAREPDLPEPVPLVARDPPARVAAVDGSHAVLADTGSVWVVAVRAAFVVMGQSCHTPPTDVHACLAADGTTYVQDRYRERGLAYDSEVRSAQQMAEALRGLAEHRAATQALREADMLLLDGAVIDIPAEEARLWDPVLAEADRRGVPWSAISKRSSVQWDGLPIAPMAHARGPEGVWIMPLRAHVHMARLHKQATACYRIDGDPDVIAALVPLCRDAVYVGYPYPLAKVHNLVALTAGDVADLRDHLERAVRQTGGPGLAAWLHDPHRILDDNIPR